MRPLCDLARSRPLDVGRTVALLFLLIANTSVTAAQEASPAQLAQRFELRRLERQPSFHPREWPTNELRRYARAHSVPGASALIEQRADPSVGSQALILGAVSPLATHIGLKVLQSGGSAADAVIAISMAQIALTGGTSVSYAGIMNAVYFEASSQTVYTLNAGFNTAQNETDPMSIPRNAPSGRAVMVPGFMAGMDALHRRFGRVPFKDLVEPAVWIASEGVALPLPLARQISSNRNILSRLPETKRVFTDEHGAWYGAGSTFRQPALAATLRRVADEGASYMYTGEWARHFVAAVAREGGKLTMEDMAAYRVAWPEPLRIQYREHEVVSVGTEHNGARVVLGGLAAAQLAPLRQLGHFSTAPESLLHLIRISRQQMQLVTGSARPVESTHTAPVVVVDAQGNVASVVATINIGGWGQLALFVDGVSIPDPARFLQASLAKQGPGARLPDFATPILVLRDGRPVIAFGAMGGNGLPSLAIQSFVSMLEFDMDIRTAATQPYTLGPYQTQQNGAPDRAALEKEVVLRGSFSPDVLERLRALGQPTEVLQDSAQEAHWVAIEIDPKTRRMRAAATKDVPALIEGY